MKGSFLFIISGVSEIRKAHVVLIFDIPSCLTWWRGSRGWTIMMLLGYTYPAYECFKTVEKNKPEIEQLRFWCQYWLPMYGEAKLAFFVYLWCPKTKGAVYVYETFLQPYVARHETEIDRNLLELRTRAGDMAVMYCQKVAKYGQTQVFEILQYVASRSSGSRTNQRRGLAQETIQPALQASAQPQIEEPPSQLQPSTALQPLPPPQRSSSGQSLPQPQRTSSGQSISGTRETSGQVSMPPSPPSVAEITEAEATSAETLPASENGVDKTPASEDVAMEDTIRVTRARLRRTRVVKQNGV
ncbi:HVA22-like protein i [Nymphaea thermarum]|nr:HVA22-like protein i [Nymphaea thermarum]